MDYAAGEGIKRCSVVNKRRVHTGDFEVWFGVVQGGFLTNSAMRFPSEFGATVGEVKHCN